MLIYFLKLLRYYLRKYSFFDSISSPALLVAVIMLVANAVAKADEQQYPASMVSGTLPVVYINTENARPVLDKVTAIPAGLWVSTSGSTGYDPLGSEVEPVPLTIRGRGNSSWLNDKKPYKLKFEKKTSLLGMPKSKHFAMMAYYGGGAEWVSAIVGFELSRRAGMPWAPRLVPVEFVLNGEYMGVYFLTETIKIDENRLNIFEQEDGETDPEIIPYGWLLEIDNYDDEYQHSFEESPGKTIRFTFKSPEELSDEQRHYVTSELETINYMIYNMPLDNPEWTQWIDINSLARYFIVREILHDWDGYNGSFYMYKDRCPDAKWNFGPVWDLGIGNWDKKTYSVLDPDRPGFATWHWIKKIMEYPAFTEAFKQEWAKFYSPEQIEDLITYVDEMITPLQSAFDANNKRWEYVMEPYQYMSVLGARDLCSGTLRNNSAWINAHQDIDALTAAGVETLGYNAAESPERYFTIDGIELPARPSAPGIYILRKGAKATKIIL